MLLSQFEYFYPEGQVIDDNLIAADLSSLGQERAKEGFIWSHIVWLGVCFPGEKQRLDPDKYDSWNPKGQSGSTTTVRIHDTQMLLILLLATAFLPWDEEIPFWELPLIFIPEPL